MEVDEKILEFIRVIRESFGASVAVYRFGNCYQFYEILKYIFIDAEPFYDGSHVWTRIGEDYYDIMGKSNIDGKNLTPIIDEDLIKSLSQNKWSDERRNDYKNEYKNHLLCKNKIEKI